VWCRLRCSGTQIIVGVWDRTFRVPEQRLPPDADTTAITDLPEGGRGLVIVRALSTAWGVTDHPCGSQVWAAL
jgi:anti-sigma regulatory factor (Ser/Thr protein kinase)